MKAEDFNIQHLKKNFEDKFSKILIELKQSRLDRVEDINDTEKFTPWFLECNPRRYPYWFGNLDPRNKLIFPALKTLAL